jgi:pimeloyl-ACP methyl ester carboxylesterase
MAGIWSRGFERMTTRLAKVNGVNIAYRVQGKGPPLVLVMGYRLNSMAWPASFIEQLSRQFTIVTLDNRGTGQSDKPLNGYALANMARDVCGLLDELKIARVHMLGYSMGGAIAQEFVRQFPDRISSLVLCATMAGGPSATYAQASVVRVMRDLPGRSPEQAARQIWKATYSPLYLAQHQHIAEEQMRREIALPTPLHAADLQFQAFAEFDGSQQLSEIQKPTLILTGDLDRLISPKNSRKIASLIPRARLVVIPGGGHRVMWEATDECLSHIVAFLSAAEDGRDATRPTQINGHASSLSDTLALNIGWLAGWSSTLMGAAFDSLTIARQSLLAGNSSAYGDGKPVILVPPYFGNDLVLQPLLLWLEALGYRSATAGFFLNLHIGSDGHRLVRSIDEITARVRRKAILLTHSSSLPLALRAAEDRKERVSDVIVIDASDRATQKSSIRTHFIPSSWLAFPDIMELSRLLRDIRIELIDDPASIEFPIADRTCTRVTSEEPRK